MENENNKMKIYYPGQGKIHEHENMRQHFPEHYRYEFKVKLCFHHRVFEINDYPRIGFYHKDGYYVCLNCGLRAYYLEDYLDV